MSSDLAQHLQNMAHLICDGVLIPFLGAGVNRCGLVDQSFRLGERLPDGTELATHLAARVGYEGPDRSDLARVAQYVATTQGDGSLYRELHKVFDVECRPNALHRLLATLPQVARRQPRPSFPLIVTTNYDDALERAFEEAHEPFDTVIYLAHGRERGRLLHRGPSGEHDVVVRFPNRYEGLALDERPVIVKIHGTIDRHAADYRDDSYVITEDDYIDYLTRTEVKTLIPARLAKKVELSHFLFLGYGLRDWNLRVILHRIWGDQELKYKSWAVQRHPDALELSFWPQRNVTILDEDITTYVAGLGTALGLEMVTAS
jgi:hypothetical protein